MGRLTFEWPAAPADRFAPEAADNMIGNTVRVNANTESTEGTITSAEVAEDGSAMTVTVEVASDSHVAKLLRDAGVYSIGFNA